MCSTREYARKWPTTTQSYPAQKAPHDALPAVCYQHESTHANGLPPHEGTRHTRHLMTHCLRCVLSAREYAREWPTTTQSYPAQKAPHDALPAVCYQHESTHANGLPPHKGTQHTRHLMTHCLQCVFNTRVRTQMAYHHTKLPSTQGTSGGSKFNTLPSVFCCSLKASARSTCANVSATLEALPQKRRYVVQ